jgi:hypothetical protein
MKPENYITIIILIILVAGAVVFSILTNQPKIIGGDKDAHGCLIGAGYSWNETLQKCVREWEQGKNYCSPESRQAEVCAQFYQPVCGWFNSSIQCIKYPCAATYSNSCFACANPQVEYWTDGECPK